MTAKGLGKEGWLGGSCKYEALKSFGSLSSWIPCRFTADRCSTMHRSDMIVSVRPCTRGNGSCTYVIHVSIPSRTPATKYKSCLKGKLGRLSMKIGMRYFCASPVVTGGPSEHWTVSTPALGRILTSSVVSHHCKEGGRSATFDWTKMPAYLSMYHMYFEISFASHEILTM